MDDKFIIINNLRTNSDGVGQLSWARHASSNYPTKYETGFLYAYTRVMIPDRLQKGKAFEGIRARRNCAIERVPKSGQRLSGREHSSWARVPTEHCDMFTTRFSGYLGRAICTRQRGDQWSVEIHLPVGRQFPALIGKWWEQVW